MFGFLLFPSTGGQVFSKNLNVEIQKNVIHCEIKPKSISVTLQYKGGILMAKKTKFDQTTIQFYRGDTESYTLIVSMDSAIFNLTGYAIKVQARKTPDDAVKLIDQTITSGDLGCDFPNGKIVWTCPSNITASLPTKCVFDIQATKDGIVTTLVSGNIETINDITR